MADKAESEINAAWDAEMITHSIEWLAGSEGSQSLQIWPCRCGQKAQNGQQDRYCAAADSTGDGHGDNEGGEWGPADPDGFDDGELKEILREFTGTLIGLLHPHYAEVVRRAEILDQLPSEIADEMNLSEREVASRLEEGRRALLHLVMLTLQPHLQE